MDTETASDAVAPQDAGALTAAQATQHADLYCALCTKQHDLLLGLLEAFGQASQGAREALVVRPRGLSCSPMPQAALLAARSAGSLQTNSSRAVMVRGCLCKAQRSLSPA